MLSMLPLVLSVLIVFTSVIAGAVDLSSCPSIFENVFRLPTSNSLQQENQEAPAQTIIVKTTRMQELTCSYDLNSPFTILSKHLASSQTFADQLLCNEYLIYQMPVTGEYHRVCFTRVIVNGAIIDTTVLIPDQWNQSAHSPNCIVGGSTVFTNGAKKNEECNVIELPSGYHREHPSMRQKVGETMKALNLNVRNLTSYQSLSENVTHSVRQLHAMNKQHLIMNFAPSLDL